MLTARAIPIGLFLAFASLSVAADDTKPDVEAKAKAFVEQLRKEAFKEATADFDAAMRKAMPADMLAETWKSVAAGVGPLKKVAGTRRERIAPYEIVFVTCEFEKARLDVRLVFDKDGKIGGLSIRPSPPAEGFKPPVYANPESFKESDVTVGSGEWKLPGTLTRPKGDGPFPAVVLVHGSGPQDRDETIGPNKTFRDLAWGLASKKIAALRYEKRTRAHSKKLVDKADTITLKEETIDDALEAVALLRKTDGIDPDRIFVVGHSLGAMAAPRIGELDPKIAGLIMLAGNARPLEELVVEQIEYILSLEKSMKDEDRKKTIATLRKQMQKVKDPALTKDTPKSELPLGASAAYWLSLRDYNQTATAARIKQPLLILQGGRDYQVTMADFAVWKKALTDKKNATFKAYPDLDHLFRTGKGKATPVGYLQGGYLAGEVIDDISAWIQRQK